MLTVFMSDRLLAVSGVLSSSGLPSVPCLIDMATTVTKLNQPVNISPPEPQNISWHHLCVNVWAWATAQLVSNMFVSMGSRLKAECSDVLMHVLCCFWLIYRGICAIGWRTLTVVISTVWSTILVKKLAFSPMMLRSPLKSRRERWRMFCFFSLSLMIYCVFWDSNMFVSLC